MANPSKVVDLTGNTYGRWLVMSRAPDRVTTTSAGVSTSNKRWYCRCECGAVTIVMSGNLKAGLSKGCAECARLNRKSIIIHGGSGTKLYAYWGQIKQSILTPTHPGYKHIGAKGIYLCEDWWDFSNFKDWAVLNGYNDDLTISRIDLTKDFSPDNCMVCAPKDRVRNSGYKYELNGKSGCAIAEQHGISRQLFSLRMSLGWDIEQAATQPPHLKIERSKYMFNGRPAIVTAEAHGISYREMLRRIKQGWSIEAAVTVPPRAKKVSK